MSENYDADDEDKTDESLMPPPPVPINKEHREAEVVSKMEDTEKKKLETPLAAMLPSKYANVDVTELFPDFRHGKVSTFSTFLYIFSIQHMFVLGYNTILLKFDIYLNENVYIILSHKMTFVIHKCTWYNTFSTRY